jgi:hypothetical protein
VLLSLVYFVVLRLLNAKLSCWFSDISSRSSPEASPADLRPRTLLFAFLDRIGATETAYQFIAGFVESKCHYSYLDHG